MIRLSRYKLQMAILGIFFLIWATFTIVNPRVFLQIYTYISIMTVLPFMAILALGLTLVVICGEIDMSFPSVMGLSALIFYKVWALTGSPTLALFSALGGGLVVGSLNGILVAKVGIPSLITTLGMMFFWRGFIMVLTKGIGASLMGAKHTALRSILVGKIGAFPVQMVWAVIFAFAFWLILNRHKLGSRIYFTGDNIEAARMMGVNVERVKIVVFALMGVTASFVGVTASLLDLTFWPVLGEGYLLVVVACVFLGGTAIWGGMGTIFGTFTAAFILAWIDTGLIAIGLMGFWTKFAYGLVIVVSLVFHKFFRR